MKKRLVLKKEVREALEETLLEIIMIIAMIGIAWLIFRFGA